MSRGSDVITVLVPGNVDWGMAELDHHEGLARVAAVGSGC